MTVNQLEELRIKNMEDLGFGPSVMKKIKKCPQCSKALPAENNYCIECGCSLPETTIYDLYMTLHKVCPHCNNVVSSHANYCPRCGIKLDISQNKSDVL